MAQNITVDNALKFPELVFGLIGAVGTNTEKVLSELQDALAQVRYETIPIHLIEGVRQIDKWAKIPTEPLDARYHSHMDAGNEFRELLNQEDALALLGSAMVVKERTMRTKDRSTPKARTAYVLRSLKRPEEVWALRKIYGRNFFALAAYSSKTKRKERLITRIRQSHTISDAGELERSASQLIDRDEAELNKKFGQNVREAFPVSDFFVDADSPKLAEQIKRIVELVFGNTFHTPTRQEYGMFHAWSASLRSASLGRQVGAAISTADGDVLATGCNEVPKAHGGLYWPGDEPDARDHQLDKDSNDEMKHNILADLLERLKSSKWLSEEKSKLPPYKLLELALADNAPTGLKKADLMSITEYGRMVHAEMAALMQAARHGISVRGAFLFCTTFPCHNCTKHIIAAGIERLIYVEPYPKSRATDLHGDSISVEETNAGNRVVFQSFVGVSPRQYFHLFSLGDLTRKEAGKVKKWKREDSSPRFAESPFAYLKREEEDLSAFDLLLQSKQLVAK